MSVPTKEYLETLSELGGWQLKWWAGVESDGTYVLLNAAIQQATGQQFGLIGRNVIAVSLYDNQQRVWTGLFTHDFSSESALKANSSQLLQVIKQAYIGSTLPPDAINRLV